MLKKAIALGAVLTLPLSLAACDDTTKKADKAPVVVCDTKGLVEAGKAARAAKRNFFTCGGEECELEYKAKVGNKLRKFEDEMPTPQWFEVPSRATTWKVEDCGPLYYRRAK